MAKKLITVLLTLTLIAGSTISIYAAEQPAAANTEQGTTTEAKTAEQPVDEMNTAKGEDAAEIEKAETSQEAEDKKTADTEAEDKQSAVKVKAQEKKKADEKYKKGLAAYIRKTNPNVKKSKSLKMAGYFIAKGKKYNLDPKVLMAIAKNESTFYTNAKSPYGYKGLMQTSDALARKYGYKPSSLYKAEVSIEVGARYLRTMKNKFKTYTKALSAYAYGEGTVMSGNYSKSIAKKLLRTRKDITKYLKRNNYI